MTPKNLLRILVGSCIGILWSVAQASPTLIVSSAGQLLGADGLSVNGSLYDVRFTDQSCNVAFNGCDPSAFAFTTFTAAAAAEQALLDDVFVDGPAGLFDSNPSKTDGCPANAFLQCYIHTPYRTFISIGNDLTVGSALGVNGVQFDFVSLGDAIDAADAAPFLGVYAVFTAARSVTAAVPEPSTVGLLFAGIGATLGWSRRRSRR